MAHYIAPEDVRKESMSFEILVMKTMDRIAKLASEVMSEEEHGKWFALEAEIMVLESFLRPYYNDEYVKATDEIKKKIDKVIGKTRGKYKKVRYMRLLAQWLQEIVRRFGYVDILPAIKVTLLAETREDYIDDSQFEGGEEEDEDDNASKAKAKVAAAGVGKGQHDLPDSVEQD